MSELKRIAVDTSKHVFTLHGVDEHDRPVLRRNVRRGRFLEVLGRLPPVPVAMEACGGSHHWGRALQKLGHEVTLIPAQYVQPFVRRGKNDRNDAEAIALAAAQPSIRAVAVKSLGMQAEAMLLSVRELLVRQRTQLINALRGHATELGLVAPRGDKGLHQLQGEIASADEAVVPDAAKQAFALLGAGIAHTLFGNGAYYGPDLTKAWLDPAWVAWQSITGAPTHEQAMVRFLMDPVKYATWTRRMPNLRLSQTEAEAVVAYLKWMSAIDANGFPANFGQMPVNQ